MGLKDKYRYWKITSGKHNKDKRVSKNVLIFQSKVFLIFMLFFIFILIGTTAGVFWAIIDTTNDLTIDDLRFKGLTTVFLDRNGKEVGKIFSEQNRTAVSLNDMSPYLPKAFVAIEDERFYTHHGIDIKRIIGAAINYIIPGGKTYGASTITQQLIKNLTGEKEVKLKRKLQEQKRALMLEQKLSKDQILELYLNTIYLNEGAYGVEAASNIYFGKDAKDLSIAESAIIAGITQYPSKYDPLRNFEASKERQEVVLGKMKELGYITHEQYDEAVNEKIVLKDKPASKSESVKRTVKQSYFVDAVCEDVIRDLQSRLNIKKEDAQRMLFSEGLQVYTTMDSNIQAALDEAYADTSSAFNAFRGHSVKPQSAMTIIDYKTGSIVGLIGGRGQKTGILTFNRAVHLKRQPGSSIKPIGVYGPALDSGLITPATIVVDEPIKIGNWSPKNWYKGFLGPSTIRRALENSMNVIAVKVWLKVGAERSFEFLQSVGIKSLNEQDKNPAALALGGTKGGVSPTDMAAAYGAIANGGYYIKPITYTKVKDINGKIILSNRTQTNNVMDERAAYLLTDMLNIANSDTGQSAKLSNMPAAGKTGTTTDNVDRWFVGYTPYYAAATWFGYDNDDGKRRTIPGSTNYSAKIWKMVMDKIHKNLPKKDFAEPEGIVKKVICTGSGKLATDSCRSTSSGNKTRQELFIQGTEPDEFCNIH